MITSQELNEEEQNFKNEFFDYSKEFYLKILSLLNEKYPEISDAMKMNITLATMGDHFNAMLNTIFRYSGTPKIEILNAYAKEWMQEINKDNMH